MEFERNVGKVVLLTGAPATGKSTLCRYLSQRLKNVQTFDYGQLLLSHKAKQGINLEYDELRKQSSDIIAPADVEDLDEKVIAEISRLREQMHVVIDSHAVTREHYGFRAIPFSLDQLQRLCLDAVLILRCDPGVATERIANKPEGRGAVTVELAREHQLLQEGLGMAYSIVCGCPAFIIDSTNMSEDGVVETAIDILTNLGINSTE